MSNSGQWPEAAWAWASGFLLALAYPRADAGALAFLALVPLLLAIARAPAGAALRRGYLCGLAFFTALLYWIPEVLARYGGLPWPLAWLVLLLLVSYLAVYFA